MLLLLLLYSCGDNPIDHGTTDPYYKPGEYGGNAMSGTEWMTSVYPSPGARMASYFTFSRDIHKGTGAHYIMMKCTVPDFTITPLWPDLPDSVPKFPSLSTQRPIDLYSIVLQNK